VGDREETEWDAGKNGMGKKPRVNKRKMWEKNKVLV
jgi:hypothetical protein